MEKDALTNFIRDFIFLTAAQTLSIGRQRLAFSTKNQSRYPFTAFSSFSAHCLHSWRTDFSACILIVTYCWFKSYGFSLSKLEKLSSESEKLKEVSLDDLLESLTVCT